MAYNKERQTSRAKSKRTIAADTLTALAVAVAARTPEFQTVRGAGDGDKATHRYMEQLRADAKAAFNEDCSERRICGNNRFAVDFYFPDEGTIVEVALGLPNSASEFEKDILKALMAQEAGHRIERLLFISRAGARKKCSQSGRTGFTEWVSKHHGISIEVRDLPGVPRKRRRRTRSAIAEGSSAVLTLGGSKPIDDRRLRA